MLLMLIHNDDDDNYEYYFYYKFENNFNYDEEDYSYDNDDVNYYHIHYCYWSSIPCYHFNQDEDTKGNIVIARIDTVIMMRKCTKIIVTNRNNYNDYHSH